MCLKGFFVLLLFRKKLKVKNKIMSSKRIKSNVLHAASLSIFFCCIKRESVQQFLENKLIMQIKRK
jgi:hypothetical protein